MSKFRHYFSFLLLILGTFLLFGCIKEQEEFWPGVQGSPRKQPILIKIDKNFSEDQTLLIDKALKAWEKAGAPNVVFKPIWNQTEPGAFQDSVPLKKDQGIFFWLLPKNNYHFNEQQRKFVEGILGLTVKGPEDNSAHVVIFEDLEKEKFYSIVLHELGHLLGLKHYDSEYSVMHKFSTIDCIAPPDAVQLCELYGCIPKSDCQQISKEMLGKN